MYNMHMGYFMRDNNAAIVEQWLNENESEVAKAVNDLLIEYQSRAQYLEGLIRNECKCDL
jgi:hypothetical protein